MSPRPRKLGNKALSVSFWLKPQMIEQLGKDSKKYGLNRSKLIQNILGTVIGEMKIVNSIGIIKLTLMLKDVKEQYNIVAENPEQESDHDSDRPRPVSISLEESLLRDIDAYAEKLNFTRNNFMERLIATGLHDIKVMKAFGFMDFGKIILDLRDKWKKTFNDTQQSLIAGEITLKSKDDNE